jgi:hypothetical protein
LSLHKFNNLEPTLDNRPYNREELTHLNKGDMPARGAHCEKCNNIIPTFADLSIPDATKLRAMIEADHRLEATRQLMALTGCSLLWAKIWVSHPDGPTVIKVTCPFCGSTLRSERALQCPACFKSWRQTSG